MSTIVASTSQADAATTTSGAFAFDGNDVVVATSVNGATPPTEINRVSLLLSTDNTVYTAIDTRWFGTIGGQTMTHTFRLADYMTQGNWTSYKLRFTGNTGAAVTVSATNSASRQIAIVPLTATTLTSGGAVAAWAPPGGQRVFVTRAIADITTKSTGAATVTFGTGATATTSSGNLMTTLDVGTATICADNIVNASTSGKAMQLLAAGSYVTATGSATTAGLVGNLYIEYVKA
jgi:hypothetical protein